MFCRFAERKRLYGNFAAHWERGKWDVEEKEMG